MRIDYHRAPDAATAHSSLTESWMRRRRESITTSGYNELEDLKPTYGHIVNRLGRNGGCNLRGPCFNGCRYLDCYHIRRDKASVKVEVRFGYVSSSTQGPVLWTSPRFDPAKADVTTRLVIQAVNIGRRSVT